MICSPPPSPPMWPLQIVREIHFVTKIQGESVKKNSVFFIKKWVHLFSLSMPRTEQWCNKFIKYAIDLYSNPFFSLFGDFFCRGAFFWNICVEVHILIPSNFCTFNRISSLLFSVFVSFPLFLFLPLSVYLWLLYLFWKCIRRNRLRGHFLVFCYVDFRNCNVEFYTN